MFKCDGDVCYITPKNEKYDLDELNKKAKDIPKPDKETEWTIYGSNNCEFCIKAKSLVESVYVNIENYMTKQEFRYLMKDKIGEHKTVPIIFHYEDFIGGYSDLSKYLEN